MNQNFLFAYYAGLLLQADADKANLRGTFDTALSPDLGAVAYAYTPAPGLVYQSGNLKPFELVEDIFDARFKCVGLKLDIFKAQHVHDKIK